MRVNARRLREIFNSSGIWEAARSGELLEVRTVGQPDPAYGQPAGVVSVTTKIYDQRKAGGLFGMHVATTHHYEDPDGRILNAAGRPDPKLVRVDGETYTLAP